MFSQKNLLQPGRIVVLLKGRHAGKKAIVLQSCSEPTESHNYPHAVVLGIDKVPKKLTKDMAQGTLVKRTQIKLFIKVVNFNHVLLTRHMIKDDDLWSKINPEQIIKSMQDTSQKDAEIESASNVFRQKYLNGKLPSFFKPLQI
ncbi:60S ribosomal protein L27 [Histomonas meleagridis]|uniref:60S ribosomal protein L27 n=1 Tax=Histomonas meleagridis TaxID=135588 RepID=UPI003559D559|nr:60S ribosomal protein L27 [Histomonas meleagridis]KAH0802410.1 60S ribosomal protein L27 [Histomonas meleagridis]